MKNEKTEGNSKTIWILLGLAALFLKIFFIYYTYWHKHYLVPPGNDPVIHFRIINDILLKGKIDFSFYPPLFHLIIAFFAKVFNQNVFSLLTNWTPILILLPALAIFFLLRQIFSLKISVLSSAILLLASNYPLFAFIDGNYPDMLAYGVFAVLLFAFLIRYFKTKRKTELIWSGFFLILIAFTHHFTFFNVFIILIIFGLCQFYPALIKAKISRKSKYLLGIGSILFLLAVFYLLASKLYGSMALNYITDFFKGSLSSNNAYWSKIPEFGDYADMAGSLVWYVGLIGFFYVLITSFSEKEKSKTKQLVLIWFLFFYIISRFGSSTVPARFARELALPLAIFIGFLLEYLFELNTKKNRLGQILACGFLGYLILINSSLYTGLDKIPDGFANQVWYWPIDQQKVDYLSQTVPKNETILYNFSANQYTPKKTENNFIILDLNQEQINIVDQYLNQKNKPDQIEKYNQLISELKKQYLDVNYVFDDVKPQGNTDPMTYPQYKGFIEKKTVLESLVSGKNPIKTFDDSAAIYKLK